LGNSEEAARLSLSVAIAKDDLAQVQCVRLVPRNFGRLHAGMLDESEQPAAVLEQSGGYVAHFFVVTVEVLLGERQPRAVAAESSAGSKGLRSIKLP
jgi:hypothetical protein